MVCQSQNANFQGLLPRVAPSMSPLKVVFQQMKFTSLPLELIQSSIFTPGHIPLVLGHVAPGVRPVVNERLTFLRGSTRDEHLLWGCRALSL